MGTILLSGQWRKLDICLLKTSQAAQGPDGSKQKIYWHSSKGLLKPVAFYLPIRPENRALSISCRDKHWLTLTGWPSPTSVQAQGVKSTQTLFLGGKVRAKKFHLHLIWKFMTIGNLETQNKERRQWEGQKDDLSFQIWGYCFLAGKMRTGTPK